MKGEIKMREYTETQFLDNTKNYWEDFNNNSNDFESGLDERLHDYKQYNKDLLTKYDGLVKFIKEAIKNELEYADDESDIDYMFSVALENGEDNYFFENENMNQDYYNNNVFKLKEWI